jgi:hypothetical protein
MVRVRTVLFWLLTFTLSPYALVAALDPLPLQQFGVTLLDLPVAGQFGTSSVIDVATDGVVLGTRLTATGQAPLLQRGLTSATTFTCAAGAVTVPQARNLPGQIVGACHRPGAPMIGFLYDPSTRGTPTTLIAGPQAITSTLMGVNDHGTSVGFYHEADSGPWGFVRRPDGQLTVVKPAGLTSVVLTGINNPGLVTGYARTPDGVQHGLLYAGGQHLLLDAPECFETAFWDANDWWQIVGMGIRSSDGHPVSFVFMGGLFYAIQAPTPHVLFTDIASINNGAQMGGAVVVINAEGVEPHLISQGLVLTLLDLETAGLPRGAEASQRQAQALAPPSAPTPPAAGVRVVLDPCAEEEGQTLVPLRLRGLCAR